MPKYPVFLTPHFCTPYRCHCTAVVSGMSAKHSLVDKLQSVRRHMKHTHTHTHAHTLTHTHTHTHTHAHTHTHTHTHARTHARSHTHTHTHTYVRSYYMCIHIRRHILIRYIFLILLLFTSYTFITDTFQLAYAYLVTIQVHTCIILLYSQETIVT